MPSRTEAGSWRAGSSRTAGPPTGLRFATSCEALGDSGGLRLWSCYAGAGDEGAGDEGEALVARLAAAARSKIAVASGLVGADALGRAWALKVGSLVDSARVPLSATGVANYSGAMLGATGATGAIGTTAATSLTIDLDIGNGSADTVYYVVEFTGGGNYVLPGEPIQARFTDSHGDNLMTC